MSLVRKIKPPEAKTGGRRIGTLSLSDKLKKLKRGEALLVEHGYTVGSVRNAVARFNIIEGKTVLTSRVLRRADLEEEDLTNKELSAVLRLDGSIMVVYRV